MKELYDFARFEEDLSQSSFPATYLNATQVFSNPTHCALGRQGLGYLPLWTPTHLTPMDLLTRDCPKDPTDANYYYKILLIMDTPLGVVVASLANKVYHMNN